MRTAVVYAVLATVMAATWVPAQGVEGTLVDLAIGPFFGQGWDEAYNFSSLPLAASPQDGIGLVSYLVMPFVRGARIEIENEADTSRSRRAR